MGIVLGITIGLALVITGWMLVVVVRATTQAKQLSAPAAARREWRVVDDEDGLGEVGVGCLCGLLGLAAFGWATATPAYLRQAYEKGLPIVVVAFGALVVELVIRAIRNRVHARTEDFPRSDRTGERLDLTPLLTGLVLAIGLSLLSLLAPLPRPWVADLQGLVVATTLVFLGYRLRLLRFAILSGVSVVAGLGASVASPDPLFASALYFEVIGGALMVSGVLAFRAFRQNTRPRTPVR